jgi:hypothetical protein
MSTMGLSPWVRQVVKTVKTVPSIVSSVRRIAPAPEGTFGDPKWLSYGQV